LSTPTGRLAITTFYSSNFCFSLPTCSYPSGFTSNVPADGCLKACTTVCVGQAFAVCRTLNQWCTP
jgi:hypothetical protein